MRRIFCRRFGASISLGDSPLSRKNDRGIVESVKPTTFGLPGVPPSYGAALICSPQACRERSDKPWRSWLGQKPKRPR
ncbi:hypothetical protein D3879_03610 [Pseudomonas cavernicola]|uniref:Uncharacterized protein n=1 Tax=Pseudomonas cavernicola TaxID=2320866 RepID=A0A418XIV2_9PSED|nr:hypothetical protein D3879_03610 [Pseudomonas cavernicola]